MRYPAEQTAARHQRILQEASRLFRERGIGAVSLPEVMKAADLTHGPFYNHFASKEALVAECLKDTLDAQLQELKSTKHSKAALRELIDGYLCPKHRDSAGEGCVASALAGEIARHPGARSAFTQYAKDLLSVLTEKLASAGAGKKEARAEALRMWVGLVGAVILARAVDDKALSDEILARTHADLAGALRGAGRARRSRPTGRAARPSGRRRSPAAPAR
jgi:TetR/AcrR family transcriptional regulator, transcriptional repressor for nem operon